MTVSWEVKQADVLYLSFRRNTQASQTAAEPLRQSILIEMLKM